MTRDDADVVTSLIAAEAARQPGFRVVTYKEVETSLTQEQLKQAAGCTVVSCAVEIAGALNVDQFIMGTLGRLSGSRVLAIVRLDARTSTVLSRVSGRYDDDEEDDEMLDRLPKLVNRLFRNQAPVLATGAPAPAPRSRTAEGAPAAGWGVGPCLSRRWQRPRLLRQGPPSTRRRRWPSSCGSAACHR